MAHPSNSAIIFSPPEYLGVSLERSMTLFSMIITRFFPTWYDYLVGDFMQYSTLISWKLSETYFLERKECSFIVIIFTFFVFWTSCASRNKWEEWTLKLWLSDADQTLSWFDVLNWDVIRVSFSASPRGSKKSTDETTREVWPTVASVGKREEGGGGKRERRAMGDNLAGSWELTEK